MIILQGIIPPFPTGTCEFPPPQANLDTPPLFNLLSCCREDASSADLLSLIRKSKGDPWHNLTPWPRNKAGIFIFGHSGREVASR